MVIGGPFGGHKNFREGQPEQKDHPLHERLRGVFAPFWGGAVFSAGSKFGL
jgi:hypothetical protein